MQMIAAGEPGCAAAAELVVEFDHIAVDDIDRRQVRVQRLQAHAVIEDDAVAVDA